MPSYWNRQRPRIVAKNLPPEPTPAFRMGQTDFLNSVVCDPRAFQHPDLQQEYRDGWYAEARDVPL